MKSAGFATDAHVSKKHAGNSVDSKAAFGAKKHRGGTESSVFL